MQGDQWLKGKEISGGGIVQVDSPLGPGGVMWLERSGENVHPGDGRASMKYCVLESKGHVWESMNRIEYGF